MKHKIKHNKKLPKKDESDLEEEQGVKETVKNKKYTFINNITDFDQKKADFNSHSQSFILGFQKAIDIMFPLIMDAIKKTQGNIYDLGMTDALKNLEPVVQNRLKDHLKEQLNQLDSKGSEVVNVPNKKNI